MADELLDRLRALRKRANDLSARVEQDLRPFLHQGDRETFRRLPASLSVANDIGMTTTCTALMTLASTGQLATFYTDLGVNAFRRVVECPKWESSGLQLDNAFTTTMTLRAGGILVARGKHALAPLLALEHGGRKVNEVVLALAIGAPDSLKVGEYAATPTIGYWLVDALDHLKVEAPESAWVSLARWTTLEFSTQMSLLSARNDAMMDPVALLMAACLAARLKRISGASDTTLGPDSKQLPTFPELHEAVRKAIGEQLPSGVWPKYFPLFHYQDAGSNYTFTFELLEAVLHEFGSDPVIVESFVLDKFERSVAWCEGNRLEYKLGGTVYGGWNSGGNMTTLKQRLPESWATGAVYMFLHELGRVLSDAIRQRLLEKYESVTPRGPDPSKLERLIDTDIKLKDRDSTVRTVLREKVLLNLPKADAHGDPLPSHRSALLFGSPGGAKTTLVIAFAAAAGWPCVVINPSHFLGNGLDGIYSRTNEIFRDLLDLSNVVVLFDEMDGLVRRRPDDDKEQPLDVTREFLTTSMLPKLTELHDRKRVVFFMLTNHQQNFDPAIKRPGRFDLLLHIAPPPWRRKVASLGSFLARGTDPATAADIGKTLEAWLADHRRTVEALDMFSFDEFRGLLEDFIGSRTDLRVAFVDARKAEFIERVELWRTLILLREKKDPDRSDSPRNPVLVEHELDAKKSAIQ